MKYKLVIEANLDKTVTKQWGAKQFDFLEWFYNNPNLFFVAVSFILLKYIPDDVYWLIVCWYNGPTSDCGGTHSFISELPQLLLAACNQSQLI